MLVVLSQSDPSFQFPFGQRALDILRASTNNCQIGSFGLVRNIGPLWRVHFVRIGTEPSRVTFSPGAAAMVMG